MRIGTSLALAVAMLLAGSVAFFCGCAHIRQPSHIDYYDWANWSAVAGISGTDTKLQNIVREVLKEKGIRCLMGGSIGYDVYVPKDRLAEAKKALQEDPRLKSEWIQFSSGETPIH